MGKMTQENEINYITHKSIRTVRISNHKGKSIEAPNVWTTKKIIDKLNELTKAVNKLKIQYDKR